VVLQSIRFETQRYAKHWRGLLFHQKQFRNPLPAGVNGPTASNLLNKYPHSPYEDERGNPPRYHLNSQDVKFPCSYYPGGLIGRSGFRANGLTRAALLALQVWQRFLQQKILGDIQWGVTVVVFSLRPHFSVSTQGHLLLPERKENIQLIRNDLNTTVLKTA
jgi:hypothetical protein